MPRKSRVNLRVLNPRQREAVRTLDGPLLVLAGAGTGKTRVITHRVAALIDNGAPPSSVLAITFTKKAAKEMKERIHSLLGSKQAGEVTVCTFHSLCCRILRDHIHRLGYSPNFTIYDQSDQLSLVRSILRHLKIAGREFDPRAILFRISRAKADTLSPKKYARAATDDLEHMTAAVYPRYQDALKSFNAVDFDDLLLLTARLFEEHPRIRGRYRSKYRFVMVDEYQDTNHIQYELIKHLCARHKNLCVVGDDDQSIYAWRGAHEGNMTRFQQDFPKARVIRLERNYRSTQIILDAANAVIANNSARMDKKLWTEKRSGGLIECVAARDERDEADAVVSRIGLLLMRKRARGGDFAVLYRTNAQSRLFEEKLRLRRIPYVIVGGMRFYDRKEVQDVLAYLKTLANPEDEIPLRRIINTPARGISRPTIERLNQWSLDRGVSLHEALVQAEQAPDLPKRAVQSVLRFVDLIERHQGMLEHYPASQCMTRLVEEIEYQDALRRSCDTREEADSRFQNAVEVINALADYERENPDDGLAGFLDHVATTTEDDDETTEQDDAVTLMTLHSAKGLEFPRVFLVGMEEGILPHRKSDTEENDAIDEERRLCYVGMTRAQDALALTHAVQRSRFGQMASCTPSRFLKEIPEGLLQWETRTDDEPVSRERESDYLAAIRKMLDERASQ